MVYKSCPNCDKNVPSENYCLHEAHCSRNLIQCNKCKQSIPRHQLAEHDSEEHGSYTCSLCNNLIPNSESSLHKAKCSKRLIECKFCELEIPFDTSAEHLLRCGSRTEICNSCNTFVMLKDLASHRCEKPSSTVFNKKSLENDFSVALRLQYEEFNDTPEQLTIYSGKRDVLDPIRSVEDILLNRSTVSQSKSNSPESKIPCEFCMKLFYLDDIVQHQSNCLFGQSSRPGTGQPKLAPISRTKSTEAHLDLLGTSRSNPVPTSKNTLTGTNIARKPPVSIARPTTTMTNSCDIRRDMWISTDDNDLVGTANGRLGSNGACKSKTPQPIHIVRSMDEATQAGSSTPPPNFRRDSKPLANRPSYELPPLRDTILRRGRTRTKQTYSTNHKPTPTLIPVPTHSSRSYETGLTSLHSTSSASSSSSYLGNRYPVARLNPTRSTNRIGSTNQTSIISVGRRSLSPNAHPKSPFN